MYKVLNIEDDFATLARQDDKFLARQYQVPISKIIPLPLKNDIGLETEPQIQSRPRRAAASKALEKIAMAVRHILLKPPEYSWNFDEFKSEADSYFVTIIDDILSESDDTESQSPSPDEDNYLSVNDSAPEESSDVSEDITPEPQHFSPPPPQSMLRPETLDSVQLNQAQQIDHLLPPAADLPPPIPRRQSSRTINNPVSNYANYSRYGTK